MSDMDIDYEYNDTAKPPAAPQEFLMENLCGAQAGAEGGYTPPATRSASIRWKRLHEQSTMMRLEEMHIVKKQNAKMSKEAAREIIRKIPVEVLAKEWLSKEDATVDMRAYLVDFVLPTLILGVERLLKEVDLKGLSATNRFEPEFNPINFLAQYLMRNNPRYSNFAEASPYVRGLREVSEEIKQKLFTFDDNRLARIKAEARRKRTEREKIEQLHTEECDSRQEQLVKQFNEWNVPTDNNRIEVSLLQSALRSFMDITEQLPVQVKDMAKFGHPLEPIDETGRALAVQEFAQYISMFVEDLPTEVFDQFMVHMSKCATVHRASAEREDRRIILTNLFLLCDHGGFGLLDRHRILTLFEQFWDLLKENKDTKGTLRNPRRWPVVEVDEVDDTMFQNLEEDDGGLSDAEIPIAIKQMKQIRWDLSKHCHGTAAHDKQAQEKWKEEQIIEKSEGSVDIRSEMASGSQSMSAFKTSEHTAGGISVTFAGNTAFDREKTGLTMQSRSQSQMSAFDENVLNVSQFVQLVETFLGHDPEHTAFEKLTIYLKGGYEETEDEKMERLVKARKEAISAKRTLMMDNLFEKWDNDGSSFLEMEDVEEVMFKYKDGQELDTIRRAQQNLKKKSKYHDQRLSRQEFHQFVEIIVDELPGAESFEYFVEFLTNSVERSYAERIRGEARKKWLSTVITSSLVSGTSLDPVYKALFQALYRDAETHGGEKKISANISMLERNNIDPDRGDLLLRYAACTPDDCQYMLGKALFKNQKGVSFQAVETGKPVHVPRLANHGNVYFWNYERLPENREGSLIVVPLKDKKKRVFGLLGIDTLIDSHQKSIFITHEIQFFQGVAQAFSIAYHNVDMKRKLLRITDSAISWIKRRCPHISGISVYMVEPNTWEDGDSVLRKMMTTDAKGQAVQLMETVRLERKDNLFRDYLFKCMDNSETVMADAYGERHTASPLRDNDGKATGVVDISIGEIKRLPQYEKKEAQRMLRLLQQAHKEITKESEGDETTRILDAEKDDEGRMDIMFDRLMLMELRENVARLDPQAFAELKSYQEPPRVVHSILLATLAIFYLDKAGEGGFDDWLTVKNYINTDLIQQIKSYDPTVSSELVKTEKVERYLKDVPHGEVSKFGSVPAEQLYNWVFVCVNLIEHTRKMKENTESNVMVSASEEELPNTEKKELPVMLSLPSSITLCAI